MRHEMSCRGEVHLQTPPDGHAHEPRADPGPQTPQGSGQAAQHPGGTAMKPRYIPVSWRPNGPIVWIPKPVSTGNRS